MSLASKLPRFRWLLPAFVVLVGVVLTIVMHWDDRAGLWWKESQASQQQRDESIWLPGYRVVIDAKPLQGLEEEETSTWPTTRQPGPCSPLPASGRCWWSCRSPATCCALSRCSA